MNASRRLAGRIAASIALALALALPAPIAAQDAFLTNEEVVVGLASPLDLDDPRAVFDHVFTRLADEVVVYPTENYYYFRFWAAGRVVSGSLALPPGRRDEGLLGFGYSVRHEDPSQPDPEPTMGGGALLGPADGVRVARVDEHAYAVSSRGRTVLFRLHVPPAGPPACGRVRSGETWVGPVFDESGLRFHLLFDRRSDHLFLILDEKEGVPETFRVPAPGILVGERTGFAFHVDPVSARKVLIGVRGENVLKNNWYDGPFDQMPDNYVRDGAIPEYQRYLEASYPGVRGRIDEYGNYLDDEGTRVAVAPYLAYFAEAELVETVRACAVPGRGESGDLDPGRAAAAFTACITRQTYVVPDEKRSLILR